MNKKISTQFASGTKKNPISYAEAGSPGLAHNGKPFRIRLKNCDVADMVAKKRLVPRPPKDRGSSLDIPKPMT